MNFEFCVVRGIMEAVLLQIFVLLLSIAGGVYQIIVTSISVPLCQKCFQLVVISLSIMNSTVYIIVLGFSDIKDTLRIIILALSVLTGSLQIIVFLLVIYQRNIHSHISSIFRQIEITAL